MLNPEIHNSVPPDIDEIFRLYRIATDFQESKFLENVWPEFDRDMVASEIKDKQQLKLVVDGQNSSAFWLLHTEMQQYVAQKTKTLPCTFIESPPTPILKAIIG